MSSTHATPVKQALQLLHDHQTDPTSLMLRLQQTPHHYQSYLDETTQIRWNFMVRRRSRLFLLAKPDDAVHWTDVYAMSTK